MKHKILLVGSTGMLGSEIYNKFKDIFTLLPTSCNNPNKNTLKLDVTNFNNVNDVVNDFNPSIIINSSAYTDVDKAEKNKMLARNINVLGVANLIKASKKGTKLIHISSDYVFDGKKGNYKEEDLTYPINYYGKTKLESENLIIGSNKPYVIFRPNVLYSSNFKYSNFLSWIFSSLSKNIHLSIVSDQKSNPTYIPELVKAIFNSILLDFRGILHIGSNDSLSRFEFACKVCKIFKLNAELISKIESANLKQPASRPLNSTLNTSKIKEVLDMKFADTDYYLNKIYKSL